MLRGHTDAVRRISFSPDGVHLALAVGDGSAQVLSAETGRIIHVFPARTSSVRAVAFSPDGRRLATAHGDGLLRIRQLGKT